MKGRQTRFRNSDIDALTLQKMFSAKDLTEARTTLGYSGNSGHICTTTSSRRISNTTLSTFRYADPKLIQNEQQKKQLSSIKNINEKISFLSQKLALAKRQIFIKKSEVNHRESKSRLFLDLDSRPSSKSFQSNESLIYQNQKKDESQLFLNLDRRNSQLNINIKDKGIVRLNFIPEEKQEELKEQSIIYTPKHVNLNNPKKEKRNKLIKGEQSLKINMKKSKIEDYASIQQKPKHLVGLKQFSYKNGKKQYYTSELIRTRDENNSLATQNLSTTLQILKEKDQILLQLQNSQSIQEIYLPQYPELKGRKTLILDLDETLIHCCQNDEFEPDITLQLVIDGIQVHAQILLRPYVITFLKKVSKTWEVVVFTASHQQYADGIIDEIDPQGTMIHHRLYRQHCTQINQIYVKDLSRLNRPLNKTVIVDNSAYSYLLQIQNAVPIFSYYDGSDSQLSSLESYLSILQKGQDVRSINKNYFKMNQYAQYQNTQELVKQLYMV